MSLVKNLFSSIYGHDEDISSILRRGILPGGAIYQVDEMIKKEELEQGYVNRPRRTVAMSSAIGTDFLKTALYAGTIISAIYAIKQGL